MFERMMQILDEVMNAETKEEKELLWAEYDRLNDEYFN